MDALADFVYIDIAQEHLHPAASDSEQQQQVSTEQDLEDQLMALGERWSILCTWVEERSQTIEALKEDLRQLEVQRLNLTEWMAGAEHDLKHMEQQPCHSQSEIGAQLQKLKVGQNLGTMLLLTFALKKEENLNWIQ